MLTINEQIYGLSLIWSEAKYNFAFWNLRKEIDWDRAYKDTLTVIAKRMDLIDYYLELSRFISLLNDGHTDISFPNNIKDNINKLPIIINFVEGKHIIVNTVKGCEIPIYSEIVSINGEDFNNYLSAKIMPYCWNAKPSSSYYRAYNLIPIVERNSYIHLVTSNGEFTLAKDITRYEWNNTNNIKCSEETYEIFNSKGLSIELTLDNIAILTIPTFTDFRMPFNFYNNLEKIKHCKGFIIDVRNNSGGNSSNADAFSQVFINGEFKTGKVKHPIYIGAYKAWGRGIDFSRIDLTNTWYKKVFDICTNNYFEEEITKARYNSCPLLLEQPVVILINTKTASSSENFLINFDIINRAIIVGEASCGSSGNPIVFDLPGGGTARICTRRFTYPDDTEFINIGVKPHVHTALTIDDIKNNCDSVLNKGLSILRQYTIP